MKKSILFIVIFFASCSQAQWEHDVRLTIDPSSSQNYSQHGIASSGDSVHVVWYDDRDGNWEIYYKRNPTGGFSVAISRQQE
ncbi:MAG: hypothetical protein D4R67_04145 [Bacteroidetes bacterium]|nr:MAG: hypothetical protein D4R67_04145 [Bacteroidota bacterium]